MYLSLSLSHVFVVKIPSLYCDPLSAYLIIFMQQWPSSSSSRVRAHTCTHTYTRIHTYIYFVNCMYACVCVWGVRVCLYLYPYSDLYREKEYTKTTTPSVCISLSLITSFSLHTSPFSSFFCVILL